VGAERLNSAHVTKPCRDKQTFGTDAATPGPHMNQILHRGNTVAARGPKNMDGPGMLE
jgi:hypothetical protein